MKILIIDTYYREFLESVYKENAAYACKPFEEQWRLLMDKCFGTADFYSSNLVKLGHEATEVLSNCEPLQRQWAKENGIKLTETKFKWDIRKRWGSIPWPQRIPSEKWFYTVLTAQVKNYRPDVLHIQNMNGTSPTFLREVRPYIKLITGQIACPISQDADFSEYDLVLSSLLNFVEKFKRDGLTSKYFKLGFEPRVLTKLKKQSFHYQAAFIGGLSEAHVDRIRLLEEIAKFPELDVWGYGINELDPKSPVLTVHHGNAWGLEMYNILFNSKIALNNHINVSENYANNMRLYEATGVGSLLLTEYKDNLKTLFEPGREVVTYNSAEECVELIKYYLENEEERKSIACAGQQRTLNEHTYYERMKEFGEIIYKYM